MIAPSTADLLQTWDAGTGRDHTGRALLLLALALPNASGDERAALTIGRRDGLLLDLREQLFGARIDAVDRCSACETRLELAFDVADIRVDTPGAGDDRLTVRCDGVEIEVRCPTSADLGALWGCATVAEARARLLARCVVVVRGADGVPASAHAAIASALAAADPQAEIELALECAACGHAWRTRFDVVEYLWAELAQHARRALADVHRLARAYGWGEAEILALSPQRRLRYLELLDDG